MRGFRTASRSRRIGRMRLALWAVAMVLAGCAPTAIPAQTGTPTSVPSTSPSGTLAPATASPSPSAASTPSAAPAVSPSPSPASPEAPSTPPGATSSPSPTWSRDDLTRAAFTDAAGASSEYNLYASHVLPEPAGLIVYLHGDGHGEFEPSSTVLTEYADVARETGMILVAPITPDRDTNTWWRSDASTRWLGEFLKNIEETHGVDRSSVWFVGYSGGAEAITNDILADHPDLFTGGGALMVGGGSLADRSLPARAIAADKRDDFSMTWLVGELDTPAKGGDDGGFDALGEAKSAERAFRSTGVETSLKVLPGETHVTSVHRGAEELRRLFGG